MEPEGSNRGNKLDDDDDVAVVGVESLFFGVFLSFSSSSSLSLGGRGENDDDDPLLSSVRGMTLTEEGGRFLTVLLEDVLPVVDSKKGGKPKPCTHDRWAAVVMERATKPSSRETDAVAVVAADGIHRRFLLPRAPGGQRLEALLTSFPSKETTAVSRGGGRRVSSGTAVTGGLSVIL